MRVYNGHPRLRFDRRAVAAVIHLLDAHAAGILGYPVSDCRSPTAAPPSSTKSSRDLARWKLNAARPALPGVPPGELSIALLTGAALARLHDRFLGDPAATDVITFAGAPALARVRSAFPADAARLSPKKHRRDFSEELTLYVVHGWLHLAGHDDLQPANKRRMRAAEARAMALLRADRRIPRFAFST